MHGHHTVNMGDEWCLSSDVETESDVDTESDDSVEDSVTVVKAAMDSLGLVRAALQGLMDQG